MDRKIRLMYGLSVLMLCGGNFPIATAQHIQLPEVKQTSGKTFTFGTASNPDGYTILCDSRSLLWNGVPSIPVMGEIHFSRVQPQDWKRELQKMKAGGITVVATYVFWNHHEEDEGIYNWEGCRNLKSFIETCKEVGLPVVLRVGPFCHGEVRNGGFPDWLVDQGVKLRSKDPKFLAATHRWFKEIFGQVDGLLWKQGGPIIGLQVENECRGPWDYMMTLKRDLVDIGFDLPFYTRTGWPKLNGKATFGDLLPLYGDYADGFWDRKLTDMPGDYSQAFTFKESRLSTVIASESILNQSSDMDKSDLSYPYFTCELGGGMMTSYHRRINIFDKDALALAICKVGSGSNLPGYYMYHGGTNPIGKYHYLNEVQATKVTNYNDMPSLSYDFQAPLGEFGQTNPSFAWLRRLHSMLKDFGATLSQYDAVIPEVETDESSPAYMLNWSVRTNGESGMVFVNNYERMKTMSDKEGIQFTLTKSDGSNIVIPSRPMTIPAGSAWCFPFNWNVCGMNIEYATMQPFCVLEGQVPTIVFSANNGICNELVIDGLKQLYSKEKFENLNGGKFLYRMEEMHRPALLSATLKDGKRVDVLILPEELALKASKINCLGRDYLIVSDAVVWSENVKDGKICIEKWGDTDKRDIRWSIYPQTSSLAEGRTVVTRGGKSILASCSCRMEKTQNIRLKVKQTHWAGPARTIKMGSRGVAEQPSEQDFEQASVWSVSGLEHVNADNADALFLSVNYKGDVAHVYADGKLVEDNFYNGKPMMVRVSDLIGKKVEIKILPLENGAPIYLQPEQRALLESKGRLLSLDDVQLVKRNTLSVLLQAK